MPDFSIENISADALPLSVWRADPDGNLTYANRHFAEYTGLRLEAAGGRIWLAIHPDERELCADAWSAAVATGAPFRRECRVRRASDGAYLWHVAQAAPEALPGACWLGWFADVHELKQATSARDEFLSIAAHELRTPLTALQLRLQAALHGRDLPAKARHRVERATSQADRLERLIDALLDVARITTGHLELDCEPIDLSEVVQEVAERFREHAATGGIPLEVRTPGAVIGEWDRLRLEQVVTNLLANAFKFGEGRPICLSLSASECTAELSVADQGIGIAPEDFERIFRQFERVVVRRSFGGLGMGLYIARQIVEAHGGRIEVESAEARGATFKVTLPLQPPPARRVVSP